MEMDELHFKNQELCAQLGKTDHVAGQDTAKNSGVSHDFIVL